MGDDWRLWVGLMGLAALLIVAWRAVADDAATVDDSGLRLDPATTTTFAPSGIEAGDAVALRVAELAVSSTGELVDGSLVEVSGAIEPREGALGQLVVVQCGVDGSPSRDDCDLARMATPEIGADLEFGPVFFTVRRVVELEDGRSFDCGEQAGRCALVLADTAAATSVETIPLRFAG